MHAHIRIQTHTKSILPEMCHSITSPTSLANVIDMYYKWEMHSVMALSHMVSCIKWHGWGFGLENLSQGC